MKCYDFELNISAYIEGDLKESIRQSFINHRDACNPCKEELMEISELISKMPSLKLNRRLEKIIYDISYYKIS